MGDLVETFVPGFHDKEVIKKMKYKVLGSTGLRVSELSLGTGGFSYFYDGYCEDECINLVETAIKKGINFIDTGPWYGHGQSETTLGKCLKGIPRKAYYLATKVGRYEANPKLMFDFSAKKTRESIEMSLKRMGLDYIDLLQVHDIEFAPSLDYILEETLPVIKEYVDKGKVRHIGITGYPVSILEEFIKKSKLKINTILTYTRLTLIDDTLLKYVPFFKSKNIGIINGAVHSMGLLTNSGPPKWHPAPASLKEVCSKASQYCKNNNIELGKLAFYHACQQTGPDTLLVGVNSIKLFQFNLDVYYSGLTVEEKSVYDYIQNNFFNKIEVTHWEGLEDWSDFDKK